MHIDCDECSMQDTEACSDCLVTFLVDGGPLDLTTSEESAFGHLAEAGLVAPLRLVPLEHPERGAAAG